MIPPSNAAMLKFASASIGPARRTTPLQWVCALNGYHGSIREMLAACGAFCYSSDHIVAHKKWNNVTSYNLGYVQLLRLASIRPPAGLRKHDLYLLPVGTGETTLHHSSLA